MFRDILVAVDGSADAQQAFNQAIDLAESEHARLTLFSAVVAPPALAYGGISGGVAAELARDAQAEAETILNQAKEEAERFAKESEAQLKVLIERRARQAQDRIARAEAQAMAEIRSMAADATASAAATIIAKRLDENQASALIDGSIKDLGGKLN